MDRLSGKAIIVTGAGAGIGEAAVLRFLSEGARVLAVDLREVSLVRLRDRASNPHLHTFAADVSTEQGTTGMVQEALSRFSSLDALYNNAGIVPQGTIEEMSVEEWDRQMAINVKSVFLGSKAALPELRKSKAGAILNTASVAGLVGIAGRAAYCASKAAIIGLTRAMAKDLAAERIRANCICPGTVDTPSWRDRVASAADPDAALQSFIARQPMGRVATAEEIAAGAAYLLSDEALFITGTCLVIDGGWTA